MLYDPKTNPIIKALYDAADIIEQRGLAKGIRQDSEGRVCLRGAISIAVNGRAFCVTEMDVWIGGAVQRYLRQRLGYAPTSNWGCASWNNTPERTKDEVVAALRETASMLVVGG
jgi:phage tail tape-measure protein